VLVPYLSLVDLDSYRFGKSASVNNGLVRGYQPDGESCQVGAKLGWTF